MAMGVGTPAAGGAVQAPTYGGAKGNMYRQPPPPRPSVATPGVGEPAGQPGHPYVSGSGTAPNPQLPEAKPGTVPKGGAATPKGSPPNPTR